MPPILNHTRITSDDSEPGQWLLVLHGIYGSGRNWGGIARRLVQERPGWGAILADLRLHGGSTGFAPPHSLAAAAADVDALVEHLGLEVSAILGHSYGGKLALAYARSHARAVRQIWVIDSTLEVREPAGSAWRLIAAVRSLPDSFATREELVEGLAAHGYPAPLAHWLGMNLEREGDTLRWKLDWNGVEEMLRDYFRTDVWDVVEEPPPGTEIHIVRASESDSLSDADRQRIERAGARNGATRLHQVEGGHWINVDNPEAVVALLAETLPTTGP
jgi:esterase